MYDLCVGRYVVWLLLCAALAVGGCTFDGAAPSADEPDPSPDAGTADGSLGTISYRINLGGNAVEAVEPVNVGRWSVSSRPRGFFLGKSLLVPPG